MTDPIDTKTLPARPETAPPKPQLAASRKSGANLRELAHRLGTDAVARALDQAA